MKKKVISIIVIVTILIIFSGYYLLFKEKQPECNPSCEEGYICLKFNPLPQKFWDGPIKPECFKKCETQADCSSQTIPSNSAEMMVCYDINSNSQNPGIEGKVCSVAIE